MNYYYYYYYYYYLDELAELCEELEVLRRVLLGVLAEEAHHAPREDARELTHECRVLR